MCPPCRPTVSRSSLGTRVAFPSNSRGRSPDEDDGLRISSSHPLFSHFYSYCRACKCSGTCAPSNHLHCHKDGLWLHGETAEGGLWHILSSSTSPSITLIRLHFGLLSVKKIHCESDIKTSRTKRGSHCAAPHHGDSSWPQPKSCPHPAAVGALRGGGWTEVLGVLLVRGLAEGRGLHMPFLPLQSVLFIPASFSM